MERRIGTLRQELLDPDSVLNQHHLGRLIEDYQDHRLSAVLLVGQDDFDHGHGAGRERDLERASGDLHIERGR